MRLIYLVISYAFRLGLGGSFALEIIVRWLPANSRLMQYLDNFRLSTRDTEEYTDHENLYDFTVAANLRSIE